MVYQHLDLREKVSLTKLRSCGWAFANSINRTLRDISRAIAQIDGYAKRKEQVRRIGLHQTDVANAWLFDRRSQQKVGFLVFVEF